MLEEVVTQTEEEEGARIIIVILSEALKYRTLPTYLVKTMEVDNMMRTTGYCAKKQPVDSVGLRVIPNMCAHGNSAKLVVSKDTPNLPTGI